MADVITTGSVQVVEVAGNQCTIDVTTTGNTVEVADNGDLIQVDENHFVIEVAQNQFTVEVVAEDVDVVTAGIAGPPGGTGPPGPPGPSGGTTYTWDQGTASTLWEIPHGLGLFPSVSVVDSGGSWVVGTVNYINDNNLTISFSVAFGGKAYLN